MKKRIDKIEHILNKCTGCMACVDACPTSCINSIENNGGFKYTVIDEAACVNCGKCYSVCPIETQPKYNEEQKLYAAYSIDKSGRKRGSSGGIFELLAKHFAGQGFYTCGAAFDGNTLKHRIVSPTENVEPLLKSKYLQSDTEGIYKKIAELLKNGEKVFFCGTPCQVAALVNSIPEKLRGQLFTADIICHGVPSQKMFDSYIAELGKKHKGEISDFSFRIKDNRFKHAHGYSFKVTQNGKESTVNGIYTDSTYYNAFKKYLIFRESCYNCQYATLERVSDITLADFWGIEKYNFDGNVDQGVSMIITNTQKGMEAFLSIKEQTVCQEFPLQYGIDSNYCLTNSTKKPKARDSVIEEFDAYGYTHIADKYFDTGFVEKVYWLVPPSLRTLIRKLRG